MLAFLLVGCGGGGGSDGSTNTPPIANAGDDQTVHLTGSETRTITISGTATDSDGTIVSQQWNPTNGTNASLSGADTDTATFTVDATAQTYTFSYTVTDDDGASDSDEVSVIVINNSAPTVDAGADQTIALTVSETRTITLSGTASDSDGTIDAHQWEQTGGTTVAIAGADTATASFSIGAIAQIYTFSYTVTDNDGAQSSDEVSIIVNLNNAPTVDAGEDQTVALTASETRTITLSGTDSDSDGTIVERQWVQTGGTTVNDLTGTDTATATFTVDGTTEAYTFSYTVTDDSGDQTSDMVTVYVASIIFSDSFANDSNWSYEDDTGDGYTWAVVSGQLRQSSYNLDQLGTSTYQLGTFALLDASNVSTASYRFSVDITPMTNIAGDSQGNDVGIMFRYSSGNYYRVSMNARFGYTRFEKYSGGSFETLAVNAIGYVDGQTINMQAEVSGSTIVVWIDGEPIFAMVDASPIASGTVALYCQDRAQFDNVIITESPLEPTVAIATPLAYSIALTDDDVDPLSVEAVALNMPSGGSVGFILNDDDEVTVSGTDSSGYYVTQYTGVADGDHDITAVLRDAEGQSVASDINSTIGVGGDYYITIGDSITNGVGDEDDSNNESTDGRIVAIQGFQAPLADMLTNTTGRPQIVFNEGIPGDKAADLDNRIASILERHPGSNRVLMMIGTNDSGSGVSAAVYASNVDSAVTAIDDTSGKQLWIAKPMPTYENDSPPTTLDATRNAFLVLYNAQIDAIVGTHSNTTSGPNFYTIFDSTAYYDDYLHPNDAGYGIMSDEWQNTLP